MYVSRGTEFSSLLDPGDETRQLFEGQPSVQTRIGVEIETLDSMMPRHARFLGELPKLFEFDCHFVDLRGRACLVQTSGDQAGERPSTLDRI